MTTEQKYGCHCDLEPGMEPDGCVLDCGRPQDCVFAKHIARKEECEYWLPVEIDPISKLERELAASRATVSELVGALERIVLLDSRAEESPRVTWQDTWDIARDALAKVRP